VDEERVEGVADGGTPHFRVVDDSRRHLVVGGAIDVRVAHAGAGLNHRHRRILHRRLDQPLAAAGDDDVEVFAELQHPVHDRPIGGCDELDGGGGEPYLRQRVLDRCRNRPIARQRFAAPSQDDGVAGFQADRRHVAGDVGTCLVDDPDDPERHTSFRDPQTIRPCDGVEYLANRVGQRSDGFDIPRHRLDAIGRQAEPIDGREAEPIDVGTV
jgi:hypothetical protein